MLKFIKKLFISLIPLIILYFIWKEILENDVKITGFLSYYYLVFILLISPLAYVFYKFKYLKRYSNLVTSFRRPIWIITWILVLFHWLKFEERLYKLWEQYYSSKISFFDFTYNWVFNSTTWTILWMNTYSFWFWIIGIIMMILLLITSNNISQKILWSKVWKNLQKLIYPLFIIIVLHIYFVWWWKWLYLYPAIIIFSLRFYTWFDKNFQYKWQSQISHSWYRRFLCLPCGFIYDEELWDADGWLIPWTKFEEIPDDRRCPVCWVTKKDFTLLDGHYNPENIENH
jgi:rubredoxin/DMSO/TMAO reductase YedYZ heme-binding membrane subunit